MHFLFIIFFPLSSAEGIFLNGCLAPSLLVSFSNKILSGYKFYSKHCFSYIPQAFIWLHLHFLGVNVLHCHDYFLFVKSLVLVTDKSSSALWPGPYPKVNHGNGGPLANIRWVEVMVVTLGQKILTATYSPLHCGNWFYARWQKFNQLGSQSEENGKQSSQLTYTRNVP